MPEHMHGGFGRFGGGWGGGYHHGWGGGWGGWGGRRIGYPLFGGGLGLGGLGLGGLGLGGGGLLSDLLSGGLGYLVGKKSAQNQQQQAAAYPQYPPQYQQPVPPYPQYQQQYQQPAPSYQPPAQTATGNAQANRLAQLKALGQLREQGVLTEDEFQAEKQRILNGS